MPAEILDPLFIRYHLALDFLRAGSTDASHVVTLAEVLIVSCALSDLGSGDLSPEGVAAIEGALLECHENGTRTGSWVLSGEGYGVLCALLELHESQLRAAPLHLVMKANKELLRRQCSAPHCAIGKAA
ncbi:hypothetical protein LA345_36625 (plasmid) [Burkholderia vietnamiensis]|uniref:Tyrosinase copper-binding domain-containing protein n=1 Tax=Burkholderia vietnamiensis (strain G4 / LMG 22486) TaxID=269482 RepID=A4JVU6_BURVG|nr:conserved hypothetical protein [Burkholderia vietnamiensis G4]MCB4349338.1 hypothetical protein [Burkholderia vietnamiensis]